MPGLPCVPRFESSLNLPGRRAASVRAPPGVSAAAAARPASPGCSRRGEAEPGHSLPRPPSSAAGSSALRRAAADSASQPRGGRQGEEARGEEEAEAAPGSGRVAPSPAERGAQLASSSAGSRASIYTGSSGAALPTSHLGRTSTAGDGLLTLSEPRAAARPPPPRPSRARATARDLSLSPFWDGCTRNPGQGVRRQPSVPFILPRPGHGTSWP